MHMHAGHGNCKIDIKYPCTVSNAIASFFEYNSFNCMDMRKTCLNICKFTFDAYAYVDATGLLRPRRGRYP